MERYGLTDFSPDRLVAMKMLRVTERFIDSLKGESLNEGDIYDILEDRTGNDWVRRNNHDSDMWEAITGVLDDITGMN